MNRLAKRIEKIARSLIAVDESIVINSFEGLKRAFEAIDDNGEYGKSGFWTIALGGYDTGYVVSYEGREIFRVNYELGEYEV